MKKNVWLAPLSVLAFVVSVAPVAHAANDYYVGAMNGKPGGSSYNDWSCFSDSWGGVVGSSAGSCSGAYWEIPLWVTNTNVGKTITAYVYQTNTAGAVECSLDAISNDGMTTHNASGFSYSNSAGSTSFSTTSVTVPTGGYIFATCYMDEGTLEGTTNAVYSIDWTP
ncbi:MAG: hypothetical protein ACLQBL_32545 [Polyangiaceae bacterium]|jgi:hypothetical protein